MEPLHVASRRALLVRVAALAAATAGVAVLAINFAGRDAPEPTLRAPEAAAAAPADNGPIAQTYSPYCQTAQGVCSLPSALPIGSACDCGGTPGRIIP